MTESINLYIVPILPSQEEFHIDPEEKGWNVVENKGNNPINDYTAYTNYRKKINFNGNKWSITCRKYQKLNSAIFIFKCLNSDYNAEDFIDSNEIFFKYKNECGALGSKYLKIFLLKNFEGGNGKNKFNYLFSEIHEENELHIDNELCFLLKINYNDKLNEKIRDNIITLLSLSYIAHSKYHEFLRNKNKKINQQDVFTVNQQDVFTVNQQDVIKAFWGYKFVLLDCPAEHVFPSFFSRYMLTINNLLDYRQMDLSASHTKAVETQSKILTRIHEVETGILYLTLFVIFDVTFTILSEIMKTIEETEHLKFQAIWMLSYPLIISLLFSYFAYKKIKPKDDNNTTDM